MVDSRAGAVALFVTVALVLTGCAPGDSISQIRSALAADVVEGDVLPAGLEVVTSDPESSRFLGENGGVSYFVTKYVDPGTGRPGFCLVLSNPGEGAASGCASDSDGPRMRVSGTGVGSARIVVADDVIPDGWTKLGDFLIVNPALQG